MIKTRIINVTRIIILNNGVRLDNASIYLKLNLVMRFFKFLTLRVIVKNREVWWLHIPEQALKLLHGPLIEHLPRLHHLGDELTHISPSIYHKRV